MLNKEGQLTIFIIIGILLIAGILIFFLFRMGIITETLIGGEEINPNAFLSSCLEPKVKESVKIISSQGGFISNPLNRTFRFNDETTFTDISYLCYNQNYYLPCINQQPILIKHIEKEIKNHISEGARECFDDLSLNLQNQNYEVDATYMDFEIELKSKKINVDIDSRLALTKRGETLRYDGFKIVIPSRIYDSAKIAEEIINQEAVYCNFQTQGYMMLYPQWSIKRFVTGDSTKIYTVKHIDGADKFKFAVRGCVMPPGFG